MKLSHIGIAVRSIEERLEVWQKMLGLQLETIEEVVDQKVRVALLDLNGIKIELLEPLSEESAIFKFLAKSGEGLHHLSFEVDNIVEKLEMLKRKNVKLIDEIPRMGAHGSIVAFIHPASTGKVLIELSEKKQ